MKIEQVALQLYTLRDACQSPVDFATTLQRVRRIGYQAVQLSGEAPMPTAQIKQIASDAGIHICATHEDSQQILTEPARATERAVELGAEIVAYPFPRDVDFTDGTQVEQLARQLDAAGAVFREAGLRLCYHNHAIEFLRYGNQLVLEYLYAATAPENLGAELDTYWIHYGGGQVVGWCERMANRLPLVHLKDYCFLPENKPNYCEIGAGTLPFADIIRVAENSGCEWFAVEQDTCPGDPFDSIEQSFNYIRDHLVE